MIFSEPIREERRARVTSENIFDKVSKKAFEKGMSINALESKAGISTGSVYKWNSVSPTVRSISKVAEVLGCTIDELLNEEVHKK